MPMTGPLPPAGKVIRVDLHWSIGGPIFATHHYFSYTGGTPSVTDCTAIATAVNTAVAAHFLSLLSTTYTYEGATVTDLSVVGGNLAFVSASNAGTLTGSTLGAGVAANVQWLIGRRYRGGRPRAFFPWGTSGTVLNPQTWTNTFQANVHTAWAAYVAALVGFTSGTTVVGPQVAVSYFAGFTTVINPVTGRSRTIPTRRAAPVIDVVDGFLLQLRLASQRRRN